MYGKEKWCQILFKEMTNLPEWPYWLIFVLTSGPPYLRETMRKWVSSPPAMSTKALLAPIGGAAPAPAHEHAGARVPRQIECRPEPLATVSANVGPTGVHFGVVLFEQLERGEVFGLTRAGNVVLALHHGTEVGTFCPLRTLHSRPGPLKGDVLPGDDLPKVVNCGSVLCQRI